MIGGLDGVSNSKFEGDKYIPLEVVDNLTGLESAGSYIGRAKFKYHSYSSISLKWLLEQMKAFTIIWTISSFPFFGIDACRLMKLNKVEILLFSISFFAYLALVSPLLFEIAFFKFLPFSVSACFSSMCFVRLVVLDLEVRLLIVALLHMLQRAVASFILYRTTLERLIWTPNDKKKLSRNIWKPRILFHHLINTQLIQNLLGTMDK